MDDLPRQPIQSLQVACHLILRSRGFGGLVNRATSHGPRTSWDFWEHLHRKPWLFYKKNMGGFLVNFPGNQSNEYTNGGSAIFFLIGSYPIGSMYAIYGNIYHQYTPNVSIYIYIIHGSYGYGIRIQDVPRSKSRGLV